MSKTELVIALRGHGYTDAEFSDDTGKIFKKAQLLEKLQAHEQGEMGLAVLSDVEESEKPEGKSENFVKIERDDKLPEKSSKVSYAHHSGNVDTENKFEPEPPTPNDAEWTQYVLGKFLPDELDGVNPRVEGLRRVAGMLVGELIEEGCDLIAAPTEENRFRACTKAWGIFLTLEGRTKRFEALADANCDNCFEDYATYLVAMADTRAKGRMFRNALHLRRVVAAEEVNKTMAMAVDVQKGGSVHSSQITLIRMLADRNGFNIPEILKTLEIPHELNERTGDVNLKELSYEDAITVSKKMREMVEEKRKGEK